MKMKAILVVSTLCFVVVTGMSFATGKDAATPATPAVEASPDRKSVV